MPRRQEVPEQLKHGPFTVAEAESLGFSRQRLRGRNWRRLGVGTYAWVGLEATENDELVALHRRLPRGCVFSGRTAARLHGMDIDRPGSPSNMTGRTIGTGWWRTTAARTGLQRAGYSMLRCTGPDVWDRPEAVLAEVRTELARLQPGVLWRERRWR
jgi:hypothetical protein